MILSTEIACHQCRFKVSNPTGVECPINSKVYYAPPAVPKVITGKFLFTSKLNFFSL